MTGPEHYRMAQELLGDSRRVSEQVATIAQVHATLALAAATALSSDLPDAEARAWREAAALS
jgi:hypothetical protein